MEFPSKSLTNPIRQARLKFKSLKVKALLKEALKYH
jgi:hypothetical protein